MDENDPSSLATCLIVGIADGVSLMGVPAIVSQVFLPTGAALAASVAIFAVLNLACRTKRGRTWFLRLDPSTNVDPLDLN